LPSKDADYIFNVAKLLFRKTLDDSNGECYTLLLNLWGRFDPFCVQLRRGN
jgi:hypothetical protein